MMRGFGKGQGHCSTWPKRGICGAIRAGSAHGARANTGVSAMNCPWGRITKSLALNQKRLSGCHVLARPRPRHPIDRLGRNGVSFHHFGRTLPFILRKRRNLKFAPQGQHRLKPR